MVTKQKSRLQNLRQKVFNVSVFVDGTFMYHIWERVAQFLLNILANTAFLASKLEVGKIIDGKAQILQEIVPLVNP